MIRVHCDGPTCDENRAPDSRPGPSGHVTVTPLTLREPRPARWFSLKRGGELLDFCSSACLSAWAEAAIAGAKEDVERRFAAEMRGRQGSAE